MTFAELQNRLARYLGLQALTDDPRFSAWGPDALNDAHLEIAQELQIPRVREQVTSTVDVVIPTRQVQTWGMLTAYNLSYSMPLAIISPARARDLLPVEARYLIYEPSYPNLSLHTTPAGDLDVELYYAYVPEPMANPGDQPFEGYFTEFHGIVALGAAKTLLEADNGDPKLVEWLTGRYYAELERFRRAIEERRGVRPRSEVNLNDVARTKA